MNSFETFMIPILQAFWVVNLILFSIASLYGAAMLIKEGVDSIMDTISKVIDVGNSLKVTVMQFFNV